MDEISSVFPPLVSREGKKSFDSGFFEISTQRLLWPHLVFPKSIFRPFRDWKAPRLLAVVNRRKFLFFGAPPALNFISSTLWRGILGRVIFKTLYKVLRRIMILLKNRDLLLLLHRARLLPRRVRRLPLLAQDSSGKPEGAAVPAGGVGTGRNMWVGA